jgi:hypothetical protein
MFRIVYIYDVDLLLDLLTPIVQERNPHFNHDMLLKQVYGTFRQLLHRELYLLLLPDVTLPSGEQDAWVITAYHVNIVIHLHMQIRQPAHLLTEWVKVSFNDEAREMHLEYDFRPTDFSVDYPKV